ncbi:MAG: hypothetical protein LKH79_17060 [Heyndrickxia oleronia]|jgi:hypothetical protein|uniref:CBO0543 family protein n=1 Tax=Heyndrickxia oleronia TaxID=38875 RepID=UPI00242F0685|nr:CBO0543 family protein [Heyndrickxia oleronia]MCI1592233.1 hypothetical protein [Heyndrickxia oleronia]MCI1612029.1 hypothetical protein [Heyndrickxia oleronia]
MITVKRLKSLNEQELPKKRSHFSIRNLIPTLLFASLIGTYLDLFFTGVGLYTFPKRPFPELFSINIFFPLVGLPCLIILYLYIIRYLSKWRKAGLIMLLSLLMAVFERYSETLGFLDHTNSWKHIYSVFGYSLYFTVIDYFYRWSNKSYE